MMSDGSAIVIGGSLVGLMAARVLADYFEQVTIIERDRFPAGPEPRAGVPQARHLHVLLARGNQIMQRLFPGLDAELDAAGVSRVELGYDTAIYTRGGWGPRFHSGIFTRSISRALLEHTVRARLLAYGRVSILEGWQADGLIAHPDGLRVTGVTIQARGGSAETRTLDAALVVDASGRASRAPEWLQSLGYDAPQETIINAFLGYASRWYEKPAGFATFWKDLLIASLPPYNARGGGLWEVEDGRWVVTLAGANRDYPPTDEAGFMDFARSLPVPDLYDAIRQARPLGEIYGYRRTENRWRHYERLSRWPEGFAVLGDAACGFNPIYGQGMTVGALQVEMLESCLRTGDLPGVGWRFQKGMRAAVQAAWLMATGEDFRYPATEGGRPDLASRLVQRYVDRFQVLLADDTKMARAFLEVTNLMQPPESLFRPAFAWRVLRGGSLDGRRAAAHRAAG
ncbi:MAG: FAD-dependent monooxygenase [Chloroflexi bacterium]|nr:FAD-dependent monooxygenase [Chloroflexota bacterium]